MSKKVLTLLMSVVMLSLSVTPVEAHGKQEETLDISTDFVKESEVEVSQQGYLKMLKVNDVKSSGILGKEKEAEVLILIPEDTESIENALEAIDDIKNGKGDSADSKEFMESINADNIIQKARSTGSGTKNKTEWGCKASLTISYNEAVKNGRDAVLLKKVSTKIKNDKSVSVSSYTVNYGCSGATTKQNYKTQNGEKKYDSVKSSSSQTKTITCPSSWSYVYEESYIATVGANMSIKVKFKNSQNKVTKKTIRISNNLSF